MLTELTKHLYNKEKYVIGVDIGKTKIAAGIVSSKGILLERRQLPTNIEKGGEAILLQCREIVQDLIKTSSIPLSGIGIGSSGIIDRQRGIIIKSGAIPNWENIPIKNIFETNFQLPVSIDNDVYAAALGEQLFGAAHSAKIAVYIVISTGVGAAIIKEGNVWHGSHEMAGQIAYLPLFTLENNANDIIGGKGITNRAVTEIGIPHTAMEVFRMAREGDVTAKSIVGDAIEGIALSLAWIQQIIDPDIFVLGGGIALGLENFLHDVRRRTYEILNHYIVRMPNGLNIVLAGLGNDGGIIGAASLMFSANQSIG